MTGPSCAIKDNHAKRKLFWGVLVPILLAAAIIALPAQEGLSMKGQTAIALMVAAVFVWIVEPMAVALSTPLFILLQVPLGLCTLPEAMQSFTGPLFLFLFIMFCMATAMKHSGITHRIALYMTIRSNGSPRRLIVYFVCMAALLSTVVADIPVAVMMLPICLTVLEKNNLDVRGSNFGSAMLIGIAIASLLGGIGTPAGSAMNMLAMQLLSNNAGINISFLEWSALCMPMVVLLTPVIAWACCVLVPSEIKELRGIDELRKEYDALGPLTSREIKFLVIFILNLIFWYTDKLHHIPMQVTSMVAVALFALPGIDIFDWKRDCREINWDPIMLVSGSVGLAKTLWKTGAATYISDTFLGMFASTPLTMLIVILAAFTMLIQLLIPSAAAVIAVLGAPLIALAEAHGLPPAALVLSLGICSSAAVLTPISANYLIMCKSGYARIKDIYRIGIPVCIAWIVVLVAVMSTIGRALGFM